MNNFETDDEPATECNTAASDEASKKRGRPKGSKNRVSAEARALLAKYGLAGLRQLCAIAAGRPVYKPRARDGAREKLNPTLDHMLKAQGLLVSRLIPELKATELTGADGAPLLPESSNEELRTAAGWLSRAAQSLSLAPDASVAEIANATANTKVVPPDVFRLLHAAAAGPETKDAGK